jgi:phage terminase small subunit
MSEDPRPLTAMQQRFVQEYRLDGRAAAAARRAGYSARSARWSGFKLLRDARVKALLAAPDKRDMARREYAAMEELTELAFANVLDFAVVRPDGALEVDLARLERDRAAAIREVTLIEKTTPDGATTRITRLRLADKSLALTRLLRFSGMEQLGHERGWEDGANYMLAKPAKELMQRSRERRRALGLE